MASSADIPGIDSTGVTEWLTDSISGATAPFSFSRIEGGHSNLTYLVEDAHGSRYVLRRPPLGKLLATAHDMAREHRIITALVPTSVPVPETLGLCEDDAVNGAPFYVMDYVVGHVLDTADVVRAHFDEEVREITGESVVSVLAQLHAVDPDQVGLGKLGRKEAYLARQLKRWRGQWEKSKTRELPTMDELADALEQEMPEQIGASIVHGDYRLGNMLTAATGEIAAVLDWELCTLGDPLADVGFLLNNWAEPDEGDETSPEAAPPPTAAGGFPTRTEIISRYEELTGRDLGSAAYYRAFQYWRLAAIVEGVLDRYLQGKMAGSVDTDLYANRVENLASAAAALMEEL